MTLQQIYRGSSLIVGWVRGKFMFNNPVFPVKTTSIMQVSRRYVSVVGYT